MIIKKDEQRQRPNASGMTLTRFIAMSPQSRAEWIASNEHKYDCAAHSEGQACCLELLIEEDEGHPIITAKGLLDESVLVKTAGELDNDVEHTTWQEWRLGDEVVKRDVQVRLKKAAVFAEGAVATFKETLPWQIPKL